MENKKNFNILDDKYKLLSKLGSGATSVVYLCESISDKKIYAAKLLKKITIDTSREISSLSKINHMNIVNLIDSGEGKLEENDKSISVKYLILEYCENGQLFDYIFYPKKGFGEDIGRGIFRIVLNAIKAIHDKEITHRDLKMENIMLNKEFVIKIADFGFSRSIFNSQGEKKLYTPLGTLGYAAPEILLKKEYIGEKIDIFSLGAMLFSLVTCKIGFQMAVERDNLYKLIKYKKFNEYWKHISNQIPSVSNNFKDLYLKMVSFDPKERPTIQEIFEHPWMKEKIPSESEITNELKERDEIVREKREFDKIESDINDSDDSDSLFRTEKGFIEYYKTDFNIEKFKNEENKCKNLLKFKTKMKLINMMNKLINKLKNILEKNNKIYIETNSTNFSFNIIYDKNNFDEEEENEDNNFEIPNLKININIYKLNEKNEFVFCFNKQEGEYYDFVNEILELKKNIKNILLS
jgi:serine/threonine protein kinase